MFWTVAYTPLSQLTLLPTPTERISPQGILQPFVAEFSTATTPGTCGVPLLHHFSFQLLLISHGQPQQWLSVPPLILRGPERGRRERPDEGNFVCRSAITHLSVVPISPTMVWNPMGLYQDRDHRHDLHRNQALNPCNKPLHNEPMHRF